MDTSSGNVDIWDKWFNAIGTKQHQFHAYLPAIGETKELECFGSAFCLLPPGNPRADAVEKSVNADRVWVVCIWLNAMSAWEKMSQGWVRVANKHLKLCILEKLCYFRDGPSLNMPFFYVWLSFTCQRHTNLDNAKKGWKSWLLQQRETSKYIRSWHQELWLHLIQSWR